MVGLALAALVVSTAFSEVPDPRPSGHHVVDLTGTLSGNDFQRIDAAAVRAAAWGELMVVVINSVDGQLPRAWAIDEMRRMRLDAGRGRGVLLMAALTDRKSEIVFDTGIPTATQSVTDDIMSDVVVANMKRKDPRGALVEGAEAIADRVLMGRAKPSGFVAAGKTVQHNPVPFAVGGGVVGGGALLGFVRMGLRRRPRSCPKCKTLMSRLDEVADDKHLTPGERAEERLKSVDYDVWHCRECGTVQKLRYGAFFTSYKACTACKHKTMRSSSETIYAATTTSTGLVRVTDDCSHCPHHSSHEYATAMVVESSSSSSDYSSSSSSSSDSGGGGSSGSW